MQTLALKWAGLPATGWTYRSSGQQLLNPAIVAARLAGVEFWLQTAKNQPFALAA